MAEYTRLDNKTLEHLLDHYDLGALKIAVPLEGGQTNSSVQLTTTKGNFILSVCDEKSVDEIDCLTRKKNNSNRFWCMRPRRQPSGDFANTISSIPPRTRIRVTRDWPV